MGISSTVRESMLTKLSAVCVSMVGAAPVTSTACVICPTSNCALSSMVRFVVSSKPVRTNSRNPSMETRMVYVAGRICENV